MLTRPLSVSRLVGLVGLALAVHHFQIETLGLCDRFFRSVLNPAVHFLYSVVFAIRVLYEPAAAFFNYYVSVSKTIFSGSLVLFTKCNIELFTSVVKGMFETVQLLFRSFFAFLGAGNEGSLFTNDWDIVKAASALQTIVVAQREIVDCACEQGSRFYKIFAAVVKGESLARAANHFLNIGLSLVQDLVRVLPRWGEYPTLRKTFHHAQGFVHELGLWLDDVLLEGTSVTLEEMFGQTGIPEDERPPLFLGTALASVWQAGLETMYLAVRAVIHLLVPIRLDSAEYVFQLLSPREIFDVHLRRAGESLTLSGHWVIEYAWARLQSKPSPPPVLRCDFQPAFYGDRLFQSFFCAVRYGLRAATTGLAVGATFPVEFITHGVLYSERNVWHMLQRYQGAFRYSEPGLSSCRMREASSWDHSTDAAMCDCRFDEDVALAFPEFDPEAETWSSLTSGKSASCAQPQLEDGFRDLSEAIHHASNIINPFAKSFFSTLLNAAVNSFSISLRLVFSAEDILDGEFFQLPIGQAGYGFREDLSLKAWQDGGSEVASSRCREGQIEETALPGSPCMELSDVARLHDARVRRYQGDDLCRRTNADAGCTCNPALPIQSNSRCGCMLVFPDDENVAAESYTKARYTQSFQSRGWCGSAIFEPIFMDLEAESGTAIADLVDGFHPGTSVGWCGKEDYVVLEVSFDHVLYGNWNGFVLTLLVTLSIFRPT